MSQQRLELERRYHESEDELRLASPLIGSLYSSGVFDEAEAYHFRMLGDICGRRVLDYGCGGGWSTEALCGRGAHVIGFDLALTRLAEARSHLPTGGDGLTAGLVQCAAEQLPFPTGAFDAVFGKQILHHLDLQTAVPEIVRILRPGGKAVFLEPLIHNPLLQAYRRLTPRFRSPTERALSMANLEEIAGHFERWAHREFCLFSVLPALAAALTVGRPSKQRESRRARRLARLRIWLEKVDATLIAVSPWFGRYYWETVVTLER